MQTIHIFFFLTLLGAILVVGEEEVFIKRECPFRQYHQETDALAARSAAVIDKMEAHFGNDLLRDDDNNNDSTRGNNMLVRVWTVFKSLASGKTRAVSYLNVSNFEEIAVVPHRPSLLIVNANRIPAKRRSDNESFLSIEDAEIEQSVFGRVFLPLMNKIGEHFEQNANRKFNRVTIGRISDSLQEISSETDPDLVALYDLGESRLLLHGTFFDVLKSHVEDDEVEKSFRRLMDNLPKSFSRDEVASLFYKIPQIFEDSILFCLACTVVLAIGLPFLFNFGFVGLVTMICKHFTIDPDTCETMYWTAIALAYAMIFPAAFVVIKLCKLTTCGRKALELFKIGGMGFGAAITFVRNLANL